MADDRGAVSGCFERVLVIDDEAVVCASCRRILEPMGSRVDTLHDGRLGLEAALSGRHDLIVLDLVMPGADGLDLLRAIRAAGVRAEIVIVTGHGTVELAVEAMREGAADFLGKPFTPDELRLVVRRVWERSLLIRENAALREELGLRRGFEGIIGESAAMRRLFHLVRRMAPTDGTVLITGESGTGKELVASAIHRLSPRRAGPFLACDCGTLSPHLLESELFGHVKGAFTGATATRLGLFESAQGGTLFLDEIGNLGLETQGKLLRVLESRRVRKVGAMEEAEVDLRLVAATNRDLGGMSRAGTFREDLYYRLNVLPLHLPPLRERAGDLPLLAVGFLERLREVTPGLVARGFTPEALRMLEEHDWPGNVRELKNIVERMAVLGEGERLGADAVPTELRAARVMPLGVRPPATWAEFKELRCRVRDLAVEDLERRFVAAALERAGGNVTRAAAAAGMQRTQFHALMNRLGIRGASG